MKIKLQSLLEGVEYEESVYSLASSYLFYELCDVNWLGFYLVKKQQLHLGPFQGLSACIKIDFGRGACGRCAESKEIIILNDVKKEANYIACHEETKSEAVFPIIVNNELVAVLDVDSLSLNRFKESDIRKIQECVVIIEESLEKINNIKLLI